ncbi:MULTISPECIES: META domain-containing protein [unclassified Acinetobacter]|uniref:META domain-containing protein n=1 Tax=unclassified Acinetobacter TaxID=196816 RepID=UPI0015D3D360|nr:MULTISPECIES: META domain-containing protein [unclassified Acinetobacter]
MKNLLYFSILFGLFGCQSNSVWQPKLQHETFISPASDQFHQVLQHYTWQHNPTDSRQPFLINFSAQQLHLYAGCNLISKHYHLNQQHLKTESSQLQTLIGCSKQSNNDVLFNQLFRDVNLKLLQKQNALPELIVMNNNQQTYIFKGIQRIANLRDFEAEQLTQKTWILVENKALPVQITLTFNNGRMTFFSGCNRIGRNYDVEKHTLHFTGYVGSTVKLCPQLHQQELHIKRLLSQPLNFHFNVMDSKIQLTLISTEQQSYIFQAIQP